MYPRNWTALFQFAIFVFSHNYKILKSRHPGKWISNDHKVLSTPIFVELWKEIV